MDPRRRLNTAGWCRFDHDPALAAWVECVLPAARATVADPANAQWHRCGGTWFAGVNVLANDGAVAVGGGPSLAGAAIDFVRACFGAVALDRGQVSVCRPGYPRPMDGESEAAFRYRQNRDAAHVDGLLREGPERHRHLREHHGFIMGVPLVETGPGASPFVVWEGSHEIVRAAFRTRFAGLDPARWGDEDVTEAYHAVRRRVFDACARVALHARPGEAYVVHRLALHGIAPWADGAAAGPDGRMIAYFRPEVGGPAHWLDAP